MRRFLSRWWPGICVFVPLLTCGCQHNRPCCSTCNTATAVAMGAPIALPSRPAPAVNAPTQAGEPVLPAVNTLPPIVQTSAKPALAPVVDPRLGQIPPPPPSAAAQRATRPPLPASDPEESAPAGPRFAHDPNYHLLMGVLDYSRIQQAWLLRYVPLEEDDRYGGCVTLVMSRRAMNFKPGQHVRVEGALIDPDSQQLRPAFEVQNIHAD